MLGGLVPSGTATAAAPDWAPAATATVHPGVVVGMAGLCARADAKAAQLANLALDPPGSNTVTDLGMVPAYARERGGLAGLRLIPGTEPFRGLSAIARTVER